MYRVSAGAALKVKFDQYTYGFMSYMIRAIYNGGALRTMKHIKYKAYSRVRGTLFRVGVFILRFMTSAFQIACKKK